MRFVCSFFSFLVFFSGCTRSTQDTNSIEPLNKRLQDAAALSNTQERDDSLKVVALEAAEAGNAAVVKKAIAGIKTITTIDQAASECALKLAHAGQRDVAEEVAKMISTATGRDSILKKLSHME